MEHLRRHCGFTLPELLVVLLIIGGTAGLAAPPFNAYLEKKRARQDITAIKRIIRSAREQAIYSQTRITLCPMTANSCHRDWNAPLVMFNDENNNRILDDNEMTYSGSPEADPSVIRSYTGSVISFNPQGYSGASTGSFGYCRRSQSQSMPFSESLIISRLGRIRKGSDSNNDGVAETAGRKNVPCGN